MSMCKSYFYMFLSLSIFMFYVGLNFLIKNFSMIIELKLVEFNSLSLEMVILFDWMSLIFMSFVLLIYSMVFFYSEEYGMWSFKFKSIYFISSNICFINNFINY